MTIKAAFFAVRHLSRRFVRDERGVILILVALLIAALVGFAGLAVEPGLWYMLKRYDQSAADVAALSGAMERAAGKSDTDICALARFAAHENGFALPGTCVTGTAPGADEVAVNRPPLLAQPAHTGPNVVEVILGRQQNTILARAVAPTLTSVMIRTRAVAGKINYDSCIVALNSSGQAITVHGGGSPANINIPTCSIISNSTSGDSFRATGGVNITAGAISTAGGTKISGTSNKISPPVTTGATTVTDPYAGQITYTLPTDPLQIFGCVTGSGGATSPLKPGLYGGSCATGSTSPMNFSSGTTYLCPGVYYLNGKDNSKGYALQISNTAIVAMGSSGVNNCPVTTINGVTIIATCSPTSNCAGGFHVGGTGSDAPTVNLSAPTVAPTAGIPKEILFYQDGSKVGTSKIDTNVGGGSAVQLNGVIYLPKSQLNLTGNASFGACTELIAGSFDLNGNITLASPSGCGVTTASAAVIALME